MDASPLNSRLAYYKLKIGQLITDLEISGEIASISLTEIKTRIDEILTSKGKVVSNKLSTYFEGYIETIRTRSTRSTFELALKKVREYDPADKPFSQINSAWLRGFESFCIDKGLAINSISIYIRNIRTVFNRAIDDGIAQMNDYPFRRFKIKHEATPKRSLTVEQLRQLKDYECEEHARQYRDIFMLIFYLCGINIIDLINLDKITNGRIEYRRAKTGRLYSIKVEPEAMEIIERYRGKKHLLNVADRYGDYKNYLHRLNKNLKEIGSVERKGLGGKKHFTPLFPDISTYWARHTWATIAASLDIPKETIAAALGHGGNSVTDIYISFDQKKVDAANRRVIDHLLKIPESTQQ